MQGPGAYWEILEIERHLHSNERWFGLAISPSGDDTHKADRIGTALNPFQIDAGNLTWGSWVLVLGTLDTPAVPGMVSFDPHRALFTDAERAGSHYFVQVVNGSTPEAGLAANTFTEFTYKPQTSQITEFPYDVQSRRIAAGSKVWVRCMCPGQNTGTLDFFFGIHEYLF